MLMDTQTHEVYDDLIKITVVYVKTAIRDADKTSDLYVFSRFFAVSSQYEADQFTRELGLTDLGKELIRVYNNTVANANRLYELERRPYFQARLNEAQVEEVRLEAEKEFMEKGMEKGMEKAALAAISEGLSAEIVAKIGNMTIDQARELMRHPFPKK